MTCTDHFAPTALLWLCDDSIQAIYEKVRRTIARLAFAFVFDCELTLLSSWISLCVLILAAIRSLQARPICRRGRPSSQGRRCRDRVYRCCQVEPLSLNLAKRPRWLSCNSKGSQYHERANNPNHLPVSEKNCASQRIAAGVERGRQCTVDVQCDERSEGHDLVPNETQQTPVKSGQCDFAMRRRNINAAISRARRLQSSLGTIQPSERKTVRRYLGIEGCC